MAAESDSDATAGDGRPAGPGRGPHVPRIAGDVAVLELQGDLDVLVADPLRAVLTRAAEERRHIVLSIAGVTSVDSAVLGVLVRTHHRLKRRGGFVCLVGASRFVVTILETMYLQRVFPSFETVDEAVYWLGGQLP